MRIDKRDKLVVVGMYKQGEESLSWIHLGTSDVRKPC